ncbi:MFS transporter [Aquabacterium sp. A08]|uniref:MFS transporter n=1 Tax=Aquabacterium sp. A08 TaxID=2718532 RepID=UPI00142176AD|nr:MFS transporter [Aquabacterium sp. A08]NIC42507.1 MFS transporter [Aquabacterium sp. A08]
MPSTAPRCADPRTDTRIAALIVGVGIVSAFHVGKLPPAIPVLARDLGLTLVQGGFLLAVIQMAGMTLGAVVGMLADRLGPRRVMLLGLALLGLGSALGAAAPSPAVLLATRALEGLGFLLAVLPAPGLLRRQLQAPAVLNKALGFWGAYMPIGAATTLLVGPLVYAGLGWRAGWATLALATWVCAGLVWRWVPPDAPAAPGGGLGLWPRLAGTLSSGGPWLVALAFLMYSGQWLAVVGFLPTIYTAAGWSLAAVGALSALAAGVNLIGNIAAGRWLAHGVRPLTLLGWGYGSMALGAYWTFSGWGGPVVNYLAVLVFSALGGLIPGTLFTLAVRLAPGGHAVSTTVGWVQQLSSLGQFVGPPLVAWLAARVGGWHLTWTVNLACCLVGGVLSLALQRRLDRVGH